MKICFVWPWSTEILCEPLEFYTALKNKSNIILVDNFDEADFIFFIMDIRNCMNMPWYNNTVMNENVLQQIINHKNYEKEIIIDYNDWLDTRNVQDDAFPFVKKYFKRSVVDKNTMNLVSYSREIIPISYAVRNDYIKYDKENYLNNNDYLYDVCCLFDKGGFNTIRGIIPHIVDNYNGPKFVGIAVGSTDYNARYYKINDKYYDTLKKSKIIVTANPPDWEGDFRLWEALLTGNLVLCDKMVLPHILKYPLINKKHIVFYENPNEIISLINYYVINDDERKRIGNDGREYVLKYHTFSNRLDEILEHLV